jgi:hypothetical protein
MQPTRFAQQQKLRPPAMAALVFDTLIRTNYRDPTMLNFLRFWRQHWKRILFRAHKDKRSLTALLFLLGFIGYCAYYGFLLFKNPLSLVMLCLGGIVAWRIRKSHEEDEKSLIRLTNYQPVQIDPSEAAIAALKTETLKLWLLLWRASSELFLSEKSLPRGLEVVTRRAVLDKLDELDLRRELSGQELHLHLLPDGEWDKETILKHIFRVSELEALQYCCGVKSALSPIENFDRIARIDGEGIRLVTKARNWQPIATFEIRHESEMTAVFYLRCIGEQVKRGIVRKPLDQEHKKILQEASAKAGDHNADLLIGTKIISEIESDKLNIAAGQSYLRFSALRHALSVLEADPEPSGVQPQLQ